MSDHADTIHLLREHLVFNGRHAFVAALDELVAERDRLRAALRETTVAAENLYERLRDVEAEFGPDEDYEGGDLGWDEVAVAMSSWRRARKTAHALAEQETQQR